MIAFAPPRKHRFEEFHNWEMDNFERGDAAVDNVVE